MKLSNKEHIEKIENCPVNGLSGELKLYRWVDKNNLSGSYKPQGFKHQFKDCCIAWGLSTYNSYESAQEILNNLPLKRREKFNAISCCTIKNEDGIKHQSSGNKNHYTFYPVENFDLVNKFELIEDEK